MEGAHDLREQARQWRRIAGRYSSGLARALIQAAAALDAQADRIEAVDAMSAPGSGDLDRPESD
jgi:hypothetical protein